MYKNKVVIHIDLKMFLSVTGTSGKCRIFYHARVQQVQQLSPDGVAYYQMDNRFRAPAAAVPRVLSSTRIYRTRCHIPSCIIIYRRVIMVARRRQSRYEIRRLCGVRHHANHRYRHTRNDRRYNHITSTISTIVILGQYYAYRISHRGLS